MLENDTHDRPVPWFRSRVAFLVWCPVLYLSIGLIGSRVFGVYVDRAEGLSEAIARFVIGLVMFGVGGHVLFGFAVGLLMPAPRRRGRIALMAIVTPVLLLLLGGLSTASPTIVGIALVAVPALLGYWATEPRPVVDPSVCSIRP